MIPLEINVTLTGDDIISIVWAIIVGCIVIRIIKSQ